MDKKSTLARRQDLAQQDAAARQRALALDASFIVQAPAGAGKTELLTQRYLGLLATVEAPEQIIAITFTRKAAAEMKQRILLRLARADGPAPEAAHEQVSWQLARAARQRDEARGWGLLDQPERLRIATIDSLCASLVRQMPYLSRFGGMPRIADQPQRHYEEAARRSVAAVEDFPAVAQALACLDNDGTQLRRLLVNMLAFREQWLAQVHGLRSGDAAARQRLGAELTANLQRLVARELAAVASAFVGQQPATLFAAARYVAAALPGQPAYAALAEWMSPLGQDVADLPRWQALAALLLTTAGTPRKTFNARIGLPAADATAKAHATELKAITAWLDEDAAALLALQSVARCPLPQYADADLAAIETFAEVLVLAVAQLWAVFQESGETDFSAIAERAIAALGDAAAPSELALRLDYAIQHLLVDEFQDTNPQQIALLEQLTAGWQEGDGRSLFVVGDPMQSIYRFRKADVGLFLRAWQGGIGSVALEPLQLYRNNRSVPALVDWVNAVFPQVFPPLPNAERGHVTYAEAMATRDDNGGGVQVHPLLLPRDKDRDRDKSKSKGDGSANPDDADAVANRLEAEAILALIDATWQARPQADIAVLVRAKDHLAPLTDSLRRLRPDWPYEAVDIDRLNERQPVQDLLALTRALCHRADRVNWLAILRAPWCGLTLADLHQLAAQKRTEEKVDSGETVSAGFATHRDTSRTTIWSLMNDPVRRAALSDDGRQRLDHVLAALTPLLMAPGRLNLRRSVETAWRRLNGPACLADETATADVAAYFNLLDMLASTGRFDLDRLENDVASLFAVASSDPQAARLRFMTIHKSKGLEFDTVILPGLHRRTGRHETRLLTWDSAPDEHGQQRLVVAPIRSQSVDEDDARAEDDSDVNADTDTDTDSDSLRRYIAALENERADQEARRLLYVAATRAKRELHLLAVARPKRDEKTGTWALDAPKSSRGTPFNILWPALADVFLAALPAFAAVTAEDAPALLPQARLADFVPQLQRLSIDDLAVPTTVAAEAAEAAEGDMSAAVEMAEAATTANANTNTNTNATTTATTGVLFTASPLAPDVGTLAHRYLELIAAEGVSHWSTARLATCRPACERWLRQQGHAADASRGGAERVIALLTRTLASERGQWLLRRREAGDACEWRLTQPDGSGLRQHIIDRSFIEAGVRWVIDYKTGGHEGGDTDAFIAAKRAEYAPQLERYAALLVHAGLPVRRALYFLDLDRFEELT